MSKVLRYAGIGSRETPGEILAVMANLAKQLANLGYVLRSGAADGADKAFELGCDEVNGKKEIWLPWPNFNGHRGAAKYPTHNHTLFASIIHPAFPWLKDSVRKLHARNIGQVFGECIDEPVDFVLCWTRDGCETGQDRSTKTGGTGTAIAMASLFNIPVYNLKKPSSFKQFVAHVKRDTHVNVSSRFSMSP